MHDVTDPTLNFEGKVALITGGSSGIGRATALAFARAGASIVVADLDEPGGQETVQLISDRGGKAFFARTDVSSETEVEAMVQIAVATYGRVDCAFNNAGVEGPIAKLIDCSVED